LVIPLTFDPNKLHMSTRSEIKELSQKWLLNSAIGLVLFGAGMSVFGEALIMKMGGKTILEWGAVGALSLGIINAGLSFVGNGIKYRIYLERKRKSDSSTRVSRR
jgi:hypothetical protein